MNEPTDPARFELSIAADTAALRSTNTCTADEPGDGVSTESVTKDRCVVLYGQFGRARSHAHTIVESRPESFPADAVTDAAAGATMGRAIENHDSDSRRAFQEKSDLFEQLAADWKSQLARIAEVHRQLKNLQLRGSRQTRTTDEEPSIATSAPGIAPSVLSRPDSGGSRRPD